MKKILVMNANFDCLKESYDITYLSNDDMERTMEECLHLNQMTPTQTSFPQPFVYYCGLSELEMQHASQCMKEAGIQAIQVAQTPTNTSWKLKDCCAEVQQEHEIFMTKQQLSNLIKETMKLPYDEAKKERITKHLMNAMKAFSENKLAPMQDAIQELLHLLSQENQQK